MRALREATLVSERICRLGNLTVTAFYAGQDRKRHFNGKCLEFNVDAPKTYAVLNRADVQQLQSALSAWLTETEQSANTHPAIQSPEKPVADTDGSQGVQE